uniref:Galectin n=1 Tax=Nomascus leucogenys TaxID=61853 RepID=A0A2I3G426_NOMLE
TSLTHNLHLCKYCSCALSNACPFWEGRPFPVMIVVPHTQGVSLSVGSAVTIKGRPLVCFFNEPHLQVDFHTEMNEESDIAFHFQVRFGSCVVMNSREYRAWKQEVQS